MLLYIVLTKKFLALFFAFAFNLFLVVLLPLYWFLKVYCLLFNVLFMFSIDLFDDKKYFNTILNIMSIVFLIILRFFSKYFLRFLTKKFPLILSLFLLKKSKKN